MSTYRIAVIPGDGIGGEVLPPATAALDALGRAHGFSVVHDEVDWSCARYAVDGAMMPADGLDRIADHDAILLGAVGAPDVPDHVSLWGLLIPIRRHFRQYVNLRPVRVLPGLPGPLRDAAGTDLVVVRENVEGEYSEIGGRRDRGLPGESAVQEAVFTRAGVTRVVDHAFDLARRRGGHVTSATKSNGIVHTMPFWDEIVAERAARHPGVAWNREHIDALAAKLVLRPRDFDVIVASNLFGDILSDLAAAIAGSIGIAPAANLNPEREFPSMFEPVHGSAPDIAGRGIANPLGALWAAAMMLDHLGEARSARCLVAAIEGVLAGGGPRTPDLGGTSSTQEVADAVLDAVRDGGGRVNADVIVVGAGLAGLVATAELVDAGRTVVVVEQEPEQNLGGQAHWSLGGLFLVDSPEQRRMGVRDSRELAWQDWLGTAGFDRPEDAWPRRWAEAYVDFAAGEKRSWLRGQGIGLFPVVGWAERGGSTATGPGNSVPRFHLAWGSGPGVVAPFVRRVRLAAERGLVTFAFRHRVDALTTDDGAVTGVRGVVLEDSAAPRGVPTGRTAVRDFALTAQAVVVASGGIGGDHALVRENWPARLGAPPDSMITGVPAHVDGRMLGITAAAGADLINMDRMWHYVEGVRNWDPVWPGHGIRILPGPSSLWFDARGRRLPVPLYPGFDTLGTLAHLRGTGHDHSWFVLTRKIVEKEFALSGSEQNPDLTGRSVRLVLRRALPGAPAPVEAFTRRGEDFVVADTLDELVRGMNALTDEPLLDPADIRREVEARDRETANPFTKDGQVAAIHNARRYRGDRLTRVATPHRLLDPAAGPLIAVRLHVITRKSLGGLHTDLDGRVLGADALPLPGLYAAGEVSGFGGGGVHGYRSLEGTFLGGCLFSGLRAGRAVAAATA